MSDAREPAPGRAAAWNRFWFTPSDPTLLGLIRICCGMISLYTIAVYSFSLQDFMGEHGWYGRDLRMDIVRNRGMIAGPLNWNWAPPCPPPQSGWQEKYLADFRLRWGEDPPAPYPKDKESADYTDNFRAGMGFDLRNNGLRPPESFVEQAYLELYSKIHNAPPVKYPRFPSVFNKDLGYPYAFGEEAVEIERYFEEQGFDPHLNYSRGMPAWSIWFHVTDPTKMALVHAGFVLATFLFMIGFCTRCTSFLAWFAAMNYIHRNPVILFGVDTMMGILLLYLVLAPSGSALSVDRWLFRKRYRAAFGAEPPPPEPSVSANVALRMLQIHVCIIYFIAGITKLQGAAWWNGTAVWGTIANFEFAPMHLNWYMAILRTIHRNQLVGDTFLFLSGVFTLAFEISYAFLIWRPSTRWVLLVAAIMLHGLIGLCMGLKTFALMMLVMNMAFLKKDEVDFLLGRMKPASKPQADPPQPPPARPAAAPEPATAFRA